MKSWMWFVLALVIILGFNIYNRYYIPHKEGYVLVNTFDCPAYHSYKADLNSMIVHPPDDRYYNRTDASNGKCFDSIIDAKKQGFRLPYNY